ncbi:MAG: hypothetical protein HYZ53_24340 [Planctomycetes bacterium]|nr:hypothetical protein [Planctomycetota bacterium]
MPRLVKLQEEHKDKVVVIGPHCQNVGQTDVVALCKSWKVNFTITDNGNVNGIDWKGIPKSFVFDHKGQLIFNGRPDSDMEKKIEAAIKAAPDWLVGEEPYTKLRSQASAVAARKGLGKALAECRTLAADPDPATAQEAKRLLDRLDPYGKDLLSNARTLEWSDPAKALELYAKASSLFQGDTIGTDAAEALKRLKADEKFQKELSASQALSRVRDAAEGLKPCRNGNPLELATCEACKKKNAALIGSLVPGLRALMQKYAGTNAAKDAETLLKSMGG